MPGKRASLRLAIGRVKSRRIRPRPDEHVRLVAERAYKLTIRHAIDGKPKRMRVVALETSALHGSIACLEGRTVLREVVLRTDQRSAQSLAPAIHDLLQDVQWRPRDIELVAVAEGPGSFTGLRVGITTAKTLAYACNADVLGVNTLDVIARQVPGTGVLDVVMDAQRAQLFAAKYLKSKDSISLEIGTRICDVEPWLAGLQSDSHVSGPGLKRIRDQVPATTNVVDDAHWQPMASVVGQLACESYAAGRRSKMWELAPQYYRRSAAEEKLKP